MKRPRTLATSLLLLCLCGTLVRAGGRELNTVAWAAESVQAFAAIPLRGIPPCMVQDAKAVAVIPDVIKAGFLVGGRFGRGVLVVRNPDGSWSNPIFVTLAGGGIGWQIGLQSTDVILVFRTGNSLQRILDGKGKLTLGADAAVAIGPVGRQAEAATDGQLKAEIFSYSRSRGLFAGVSLEGAGLLVDCEANQAFYGLPGGRPADVLAFRPAVVPAPVAALQCELSRLSAPPPPPPPPALMSPATPPPPLAPVAPAPPPLPPGR
jgi:lipid-binding SYLF domain-containing protein